MNAAGCGSAPRKQTAAVGGAPATRGWKTDSCCAWSPSNKGIAELSLAVSFSGQEKAEQETTQDGID